MPILDDNLIIMRPSDLIGCDNKGTKGVKLGQLVLGEPVSHYQYKIVPISSKKLYVPDPFILHSLVSGRVEALKYFNKYIYNRTERCSVLLAIILQQCYIMGC